MTNSTLLVELLTEELPPKALKQLGNAFSELLSNSLREAGHLGTHSVVQTFATPRRLGCTITQVAAMSPSVQVRERLVPAAIGLDQHGQLTAPLLKKLAALGLEHLSLTELEKVHDGKQDVLHVQRTLPGKTLAESVSNALEVATGKLPIPKVMAYQRPDGNTVRFVRPAHGLIVLHGSQVVPTQILGLESGRTTLGHRFLCQNTIDIESADNYENQLFKEGHVMASFAKRKLAIEQQIQHHAGADQAIQPDSLLDEVCALVEWPQVYEGHFDAGFLEVPQECLILTMQANQKYFALTDTQGQMKNRFLLVSNLETTTPQAIVHGNERVLRARLADAKFFFDQDRKKSLESRVEHLSQVVYHNKLGTQQDRNARLIVLAEQLAPACGAEPALARRAALLCKADLLTDMVGEFPELQGTMGEHYARHDGEPDDVAQAIADHYRPRYAGDSLPRNAEGLALALADKLETLCGIYGIGLVPTGDKDPFALRRHALGLVRMAIEKELRLNVLQALQKTNLLFSNNPEHTDCSQAVFGFVLDRLRVYLRDQGYTANEVESVISQQPTDFSDLIKRLEAVRAFASMEEAEALAAANKRIANLLKKVQHAEPVFQAHLLKEPAEIALARKVEELAPRSTAAFERGDYQQALALLAPLRPEVDAFFLNVMVLDKDEALQTNRIALLLWMHGLMNRVADISQLA